MSRSGFLALAAEPQAAIWRAALEAHDVSVESLAPGAHLQTAVAQAMGAAAMPLLVIDLALLARQKTSAGQFVAWKRLHGAHADLLLVCSSLYTVHPQARAWAKRLGARDLLPGCDLSHWRQSLLPSLNTLLGVLGAGTADETVTACALQPLPTLIDRDTPVAQAWRHMDTFSKFGMTPDALLAALANHGVAIRARRYGATRYDECFVGADAVTGLTSLAKAAGAPHARHDVLPLGQALLELGYIYHVVREQPFRDGHFFYRVRAQTPKLNALDLHTVLIHMRGGEVRIRDRKYHGVTYPKCFVGAEALAWMRNVLLLSENEALTLGERLLELYSFHHVLDEHHFRGGKRFFRFYQDE